MAISSNYHTSEIRTPQSSLSLYYPTKTEEIHRKDVENSSPKTQELARKIFEHSSSHKIVQAMKSTNAEPKMTAERLINACAYYPNKDKATREDYCKIGLNALDHDRLRGAPNCSEAADDLDYEWDDAQKQFIKVSPSFGKRLRQVMFAAVWPLIAVPASSLVHAPSYIAYHILKKK